MPHTGDCSRDIMVSLIQLLRAEGNNKRADELEEHERAVNQMFGSMRRI